MLESGPIVDKAPGGKEVVKPANVIPTVLHPSDARIDGMMAYMLGDCLLTVSKLAISEFVRGLSCTYLVY